VADTRRQQILSALITRLQGILVSGGYETDAGRNVFEWPDVELSDEDEMPAIVVRDTQGPVERNTNATDLHTLTVSMECLAKGSAAPAEVRKVMGDVIKAIGVDLTFGNLAEDSNLTSVSMLQVSHEDRRLGGGEVTVELQYTTNHFDPFS